MRRISRLRRTSQAILVGWLVLAAIFETGAIVGIRGSTSAPLPQQNISSSWNPNVSCTPLQVRISDITANQTQAASYQSSPFTPGISTPVTGGVAKRWLTPGPTPAGWVSPGPPCTKSSPTGTTTLFVELDGVERNDLTNEDWSTIYDPTNGGSPHSSLTGDTTFNLFDPAMVPHYFLSCTAPTDPTCYGRIHAEIDHDWKAAGYCGTGTACDNTTLASQTVTASTKIDIQGFVYWDNGNLNSSWHQYNGWEIHPVTAWRISNPNPPDYTLTANPSNVNINAGSTGSSILTVNSTNGFTGTVDLTAAVNSTNLTCTLSSTSINNGSGTSAISCNSSIAGNYQATVIGTSGSLTHTAIVVFQVQDFNINANPSSLTISIVSGTPGTSSIDLSSLNGFAGTVNLTASIAPNGLVGLFPPRTSLSPTTIALTSDGTGESILTVSPSLLTTPGTYTVSITAKNSSLSHSTDVTVTVGLA